ncbi:Surface polysaccharide O-acyltransferase, integral membrane enzyme [Cnuella takakiae]|uniref:Surface polysaccharide O-acyltransferase, integral membrane enzyme n=1 Tax=Cnuella takakiae TaxID=1302690 RepID=A0A1M5CKF2_9BACT|nr:acyltransferase [Cnuella takakiae]OLY91858.1 hypothetical protein BUE76_08060 [Cnuella takakiae]SHF55166.1 Surface polysaccharide O-acyltransferase, integral membrane enzyme [Cnuella takakiae]
MNRNSGVDLMRLIGALCIITIHTDYDTLSLGVSGHLKLASRWAVPFYFLVSGFYIGKKYWQKQEMQLSSLHKTISLYLIASLVFLPIAYIKNIHFGIGHFTSNVEMFLYGSYWHLWFLGSLILGILTLWYFISAGHLKKLYLISVLILLYALYSNSYFNLVKGNSSFEFPRFLLSIPFLFAGFNLSNQNLKSARNMKVGIVMTIFGLCLQILESIFFQNEYGYSILNQQFLFGTILSAFGVFLLALNIDLKSNMLSNYGEKYSLFIYLYHPITIMFQNYVLLKFYPNSPTIILLLFPFITLVITIMAAICIEKWSPKIYRIINGSSLRQS